MSNVTTKKTQTNYYATVKDAFGNEDTIHYSINNEVENDDHILIESGEKWRSKAEWIMYLNNLKELIGRL